MKWVPVEEIEGCGLIQLEPTLDERGYSLELFNKRKIAEFGIPVPWSFAQENLIYSDAGVLQGFHLQHHNPQGKLVMCLGGKIIDVCLDVRPKSSTFMRMTRVALQHESFLAFWLPPGTAHAFYSLEPSYIHYLCSTPADLKSQAGINALDPELAIAWNGLDVQTAKRSQWDKNLPGIHRFVSWRP